MAVRAPAVAQAQDPSGSAASPSALPHDRKPLRDMGRGARAFLSDAICIYTAPVRMKGPQLALTAGVLGLGALTYEHDEDILNGVQRRRDQAGFNTLLDIGYRIGDLGHMGKTNVWYMAALGAGYALDIDVLRTIPAELLESHFIAGAFRQIGEHAVGRRRPFEGLGPHEFDPGNGTSFPSGHASVIFEVATVLSHHLHHPAASAAVYGLAGTVALQRIDSGNHWPSDVLLAAAYGAYVARTVVRRNDDRRAGLATAANDGDLRGPAWAPRFGVSPSGWTAEVRASF